MHHNHKDLTYISFVISYELLLQQESYALRAQTSADPEDPDFRLWTPGSEA